jgi:hypothetical protein
MTTQSMRSIAGVSVPDSPLIAEAIEYAQRLSEPYLFNHAMRSWLFAAKIGQVKAIECDEEVVAVGAILHDIGLTNGVGGDNRFEVNGANAVRSFIEERGLSDRRAQLAWDLVALNSTASIALHKEPEVALGTRASPRRAAISSKRGRRQARTTSCAISANVLCPVTGPCRPSTC